MVCSLEILWLSLSGGATVCGLISTDTASSEEADDPETEPGVVTSALAFGGTVVSGGVTGRTVGGATVDVVVVLLVGGGVAGAV